MDDILDKNNTENIEKYGGKYSLLRKQILYQQKNLWSIFGSYQIPNEGLNDISVMNILYNLSSQNLCNGEKTIRIGERESRTYSNIVKSRYYGFGHGIGRSGNIEDAQPKSESNKLISIMVSRFLKDLIRSFGIKGCNDVVVLPYATGMCLSTCLLLFKKWRKEGEYLIVSRIDQKSCYKAVDFCNINYLLVDQIIDNGELTTDVKMIEELIKKYKEKIIGVMTTTSSYAPRNSDDIVKVSKICQTYDIPHLVNNAFGLQCTFLCKEIQKCYECQGRIDYVVQSCDKNFLVPVSGGIIFGSDKKKIEQIKKMYPGRAHISAYLDLFITLLQLGKNKIFKLRKEREENYNWLKEQTGIICSKYNLELIKISRNKLSIGVNLNELYKYSGLEDPKLIQMIGSMLFYRNVTGHRVICSPLLLHESLMKKAKQMAASESYLHNQTSTSNGINVLSNTHVTEKKNGSEMKTENFESTVATIYEKLNAPNIIVIDNTTFTHFGSSCNTYPFSYISFSCAIGVKREELEHFLLRFDSVINDFIKKFERKEKS